MEKERKGLFGRLLDFWKEKISMGETDSIGFWHDTENVENHFDEMGAVAALTQTEMKKNFWEETEAAVSERQRAEPLEERKQETGGAAGLFSAEVFRREKREELQESCMVKPFLQEMPEKETEKRSILPAAEMMVQEREEIIREVAEQPANERKREATQAEPVIDIEKLMRQMTKKLWEEREGCGRRLR